ncbi:hypothetical protein PTKIN_Ptkin10aG0045900 [Pterospermum kingtungense]
MCTKRGESNQNPTEKNGLVDSYICCRHNSRVAEIAEAMENNFPSSPDERKPDPAQIESVFNYPANEARDVGSGTQLSRMEMVLESEVNAMVECEACGPLEKNIFSSGKKQEESAGKSVMKGLEATAANELQTLMGDNNARMETSKVSASESASEVEKNFEQIPPEKMSTDKHSPTHSRIVRYRRRGKEKALPDGDVKGMMSNKDDDSHESVESCNRTGLFSSGKKRWGFEQQLSVGCKKVKKQIDESPCSSPLVKQDSSFTNWISNMMKGFMKSKDETPSLALTIANPIQSHENPDKNLDTSEKNLDPAGCRNIGFQSIFHSMYSPKSMVQGTTQNENYQKELELTNKICDIDATPLACHAENVNFFHKVFLLSNERFRGPLSGGRAGPPTQSKILSMNLSSSKRSSEGNSAENNRASSSSSLGKHMALNAENIDSDPPSEGKTVHRIRFKSNLLGSLWITPFTTKSSSSLLNQDTSGVAECSSDRMKLIPCSQNTVNFSSNLRPQCAEEPLASSGKELPNFVTEIEASIAVHNDQKSKAKFSPILPSPRLKDSEAMASLFARRLDALKHIMPSGMSDNTTSATMSCFFCGRKGHHLQYCPQIIENEIDDLVRNMKSSNRLEESACVCIRCFELDHWAVACPNTSSRGEHQRTHGASLPNLNELQFYARFEENKKLGDGNREAISAREVCDGIDVGKGPSINHGVTGDKMRSKTNMNEKYAASSSNENELNKNQITPWGNFDYQQLSDMPEAIFKAVRMLRLSRTDILNAVDIRWMNSQISLSYLEGSFLRLRLGKWEEGLGITGYYVACITGADRQATHKNSKNSISVNVGGIKCLVESQYISNHDFLEDELMAWLRATTKSGGKIPSQEELAKKLIERRMFGF